MRITVMMVDSLPIGQCGDSQMFQRLLVILLKIWQLVVGILYTLH